MYWKGIKGLVFLLAITLVFPSSITYAAVKKSSQKRTASSTQVPSSARNRDGKTKHHQRYSESDAKETPLVRLKRIKREVEKASSQVLHSMGNNAKSGTPPHHPEPAAFKVYDKTSLINTRPTSTTDGRKPAISSSPYRDRDSIASRVHTEMLRRKEGSNRKTSYRGKGHSGAGPSGKMNELSERIQVGGRHHVTGTGSYVHHRNEQNRLESAAEAAALRQRARKKNKHQKNRGEYIPSGNNGEIISHPWPVGSPEMAHRGQTNRYHNARGDRGRGPSSVKGQEGPERKHRARRGQRTELTPANGGDHGQIVRAELEQIRRMQRDLMKEISHLEHMKKRKKKPQSKSASISQQNHQHPLAKSKRK